jgi:non-homologous end joining protein Ku
MEIDLNGFRTDVSLNSVGYASTRGIIHNYSECCGAEAGKQDYCKKCGMPVPKDGLKKGVEMSKGEVAYFTPDEIKSLKVRDADTLKIDGVVALSNLERFEPISNYWLAPKKKSEARYSMLLSGLSKTEGSAEDYALIGKGVIRGSEYVCAIYEHRGTLRLTTLLFATDQRENRAKAEQASPEIAGKMFQLIKAMPQADLVAYADGYAARLMGAVEARLAGKEVELVAAPINVGSEMDELERALAVAKVGAKR